MYINSEYKSLGQVSVRYVWHIHVGYFGQKFVVLFAINDCFTCECQNSSFYHFITLRLVIKGSSKLLKTNMCEMSHVIYIYIILIFFPNVL